MTDSENVYSVESEATANNETPSVDDSQQEAQPAEVAQEEQEPEVIDKKRHKEILHWKELELQQTRDLAYKLAFQNATNDTSTLLEVHKADPKLAARVAKEFDWEATDWWTYENFIENKKVSKEKDFETYYEQRRKKEIHEESLIKAQKIIDKLSDDVKEEAQAYFDDITEWKLLNEEKALKYAEMASVYVSKDRTKKEKKEEAEKALSSVSLPKGNVSSSKHEPKLEIVNGRFQLIYPDTNKN